MKSAVLYSRWITSRYWCLLVNILGGYLTYEYVKNQPICFTNIFTYKNINCYLVLIDILQAQNPKQKGFIGRATDLGGISLPRLWTAMLLARAAPGELYPSRMILEHDGLKWLKHQSDPNISQSWRGGLAL